MGINTISKLPIQGLRHLLICAGGIAGVILLAIYPYHRFLASQDEEIKKIEIRIEKQGALFPLYQNLLKKVNLNKPAALPFIEKDKLDREKTMEILSLFDEMARMSNLEPVSIVPDVRSLTRDASYLSVRAYLKGDFFDFRDLLIRIGEVPYLEHIEEIRIQPEGEVKAFRLTGWLALKKTDE